MREVISFYYPHSVHRSIVSDLGVTTPKQLARTLSKYSRRHPELRSSSFVIPQVPGTVPRSKPVRGVLDCALTAKKYMLPLFLLHPYIAGSLIAVHFSHGRFDPSRNALILDSKHQLGASLTRMDRRLFNDQLQERDSNRAFGVRCREWARLDRLCTLRPSPLSMPPEDPTCKCAWVATSRSWVSREPIF